MHVAKKQFDGEVFSHQDLSEATFEQCQFYHCDFSRANLTDACFIDCSFIEAGETDGCNFAYTKLKDASFKGCNLAMANFRNAQCFGIELHQCNLKGVDFHYASFANYITHNSFFCSAFISGCDLSYANLESVMLEKCELFENRWRGANLIGVSFKGSDLSRGEFSSEQWQQAIFNEANLCHVDLDNVDVRRVSLEGVQICDWQQEQLLGNLGIVVL